MIDNRIAFGVAASARLLLLTAGLLGGLSPSTTSSFAQDCQDQQCTDGGTGGGGTGGGGTGGGGTGDGGTGDGGTGDGGTGDGGAGDGGAGDGGAGDGGAGDGGSVGETTGGGDSNSGQTTEPTLPEPQAPAPTVVTPTVTSLVGDPFVTTTIVTLSTNASLLVGSGRNAVIEAMLPDGMKSSAQNAYRLLGTGSIDLLQIEAAANAYKAFSDLDSVEQQTLFEFMFYDRTSLQEGYLALMKILPSDDPLRAKLLAYGDASIAATMASGNKLWAFKRAVTLGYSGKIARLSGLSPELLKQLCEHSFKTNIDDQSHCKESVL